MYSKTEFIARWEAYAGEFSLLGQSVKKPETWEEIKQARATMERIIRQVAQELYETN